MDSAQEVEPGSEEENAASPNGEDLTALEGNVNETSEAAEREEMRDSVGRSVCVRCAKGCLGGFLNATDAMIDYCERKCGETGFKCATVMAGCVGLVGTLVGAGILLNELTPS